MNIFELKGLFNPKEIESRTVTTGGFNNFIRSSFAVLKIIGVETKYKDSRLFSGNKETLEEVYKELRQYKSKTNGNTIAETTIYIKVIKATGINSTMLNHMYFKIVETVNLGDDVFNYGVYENLIRDNHYKNGLKYSNPHPNEYYLNLDEFKHKKRLTNRFNDLLGLEFLVTGLGVPIDPKSNKLDNLLILKGGLKDYWIK